MRLAGCAFYVVRPCPDKIKNVNDVFQKDFEVRETRYSFSTICH